MVFFPDFGNQLKLAREFKCLSQKELAKVIGIEQATISRLENSDNDPETKTLRRLIDYFGCDADELLFAKKDVGLDPITKDTALIMRELPEYLRYQINDVAAGMKARHEKEERTRMRVRA